MELNRFNEVLLDEQDIIKALYSGQVSSLDKINVIDQGLIDQFNNAIRHNGDRINRMHLYSEPTCSVQEFNISNQSEWFIPEEYKDFNIAEWLLTQCKTEIEYARVLEELELYVQHDMIDVLICIKYLVDFMRKNNIVWGLGRGSSVASYCLYLIGIHKVDSIKYQLDIKEFLKGDKNGKKSL